MARVYIVLGTNLGNRAQHLRGALARLEDEVTITDASHVYETEPWGVKEQPRFFNLVIAGETKLEPHALLAFLKTIEQELGRSEGIRYGPRVIDLDILFYDNQIIDTPDLVVPHPRLTERRFVLVPLAEISPDLLHPLLGLPIHTLLAQLSDEARVQVYLPPVQ